ncbi:MAG: ORF6N domain-containing protein [Planctomycetes bacterium]|nr:ORF6N domain-containing protein [Planctomycetota bacterium]
MIPVERIEQTILLIRGHKVILDTDLASLYRVPTKRLNEQVRRNRERFPEDFLIQLTRTEYDRLRSQFATLKTGRGQHRKYLPYAFTEHGALMAATVLNSPVAVHVSIQIVRTFVRLRQILATHVHLARRLVELEQQYDAQFKVVFEALRALMEPPKRTKKPIGFHAEHRA